ncbi:LapB repeat-containing protein [Listeria monocytogenes]|uniref:LPXTG cell wall anchor domain-containing protein n=1 Tax=Listeria monocytogenes TaxID=1639 RepID=A0AAD2M946_LISMN|nr:LPXTG cell wall anchor domain-containing protein [Listeria monocytogenes]EAE5698633.1 LPXTG cell wall anchor domain-containing protein [Listeria monocytogenes]EAE9313725.1 LPXTG cell wall anchor domain-containing protein [Listeria monocytogenes]EAF1627468.1 LPXTG cell wall anchor domain-containing protein [Listeria monocytogenes]EAF2622106.1 LPXTG cell wall anchor domain-containing protein [Listeria monocytogenes]
MSIKSKIMKIGICSVIVLMPLSQISLPIFAAEEVADDASQDIVNMPDSALKAQLNQIIGQAATADITKAQMLGFDSIGLYGSITDLTGLEAATNLKTLTINNATITNYESVAKLTNLNILWIENSNLTSNLLPDLNGLTNLTTMSLSNNKLDNSVYPKIKNLSNLANLNLSSNPGITNISELRSLANLTTLNVSNCQIADLSGLDAFPKITTFNGGTQRYTPLEETAIKSKTLNYNATEQTMFIPFDIMTPSSITNFNGAKITPSYQPDMYMIEMNNGVIDGSRMTGSIEGITVSDVTPSEFDQFEKFTLYTLFDFSKAGTPDNLVGKTYTVSAAGIQKFTVDHSVGITAEGNITYVAGETVTPEKFLADIKADANGATITSDVAEKVNFATPGTYTVTLNAQNTLGVKSEPFQVTVTVEAKTVITADPEVTYSLNEAKTEEEFLTEIKAMTNNETPITSDFATVVDFTKPGKYTVTLNAESALQKAAPLTVTVKISETIPNPEPTPGPDSIPESEPTDPANPANSIYPVDSVVEISTNTPVTTMKLLPKTGDSLPVNGIVVGFLVLGLGVMIARKK